MRYLQAHIEADLAKKMVFVGGPRQCGKTTLAKQVLERLAPGAAGVYLNWDEPDHRADVLARRWRTGHRLVVFDELHKYRPWKTWLKGSYDTRPDHQSYLVTGSARLDLYRRGGDSMLGRYHYWRLHPFCLGELPPKMKPAEAMRRLLTVGGFPEPFLDGDPIAARRWRRERVARILRDDVRDIAPLHDLSTLGLFARSLMRRVGGRVVLANLATEFQIAHKTARHWLEVLGHLYLAFLVRPYTANLARSLSKPPKVYFYDNADVEGDEGSVFENLVATHLLKRLQFLEDRDGYSYELRYLRDREKREVDFVVLKDGAVDMLVEAKWADDRPSSALRYYADLLKPRRVLQVVGQLRRPYDSGVLQVRSAHECLTALDALP